MWDQLELPSIQFKKLTAEDITDALIELSSKSPENNYTLYCNTETAEIFVDFGNKKKITVYGVKLIGRHKNMFTYEGVLFDKFPDDYDSLYIGYRNRFDCERAEEIEILELTDTKIVFKCSVKFPEGKDNIILQWN